MITTAQDIGELPGPADAAALMDQLLGHVRIQILHGVAALHVAGCSDAGDEGPMSGLAHDF